MAVIAWRNAAEAAGVSLSVSSEAAGLGVQSLLTPTIADVWRSGAGGAVTHVLAAFLPAAMPMRLVAIGAPRDGILPGAGATWRVQLGAAAGGAEIHDSGVLPLDLRRGTAALLLPAGLSARAVTVRVTGAPADPYLQLGRLWAGDALVPDRAVAYGWARGAGDAGALERAPISGVLGAQRGAAFRSLDFDLPLLTSPEALQLDEAALALGTTGQGFVSPLNLDLRHGFFGRFTAAPAPAQRLPFRFAAKITFQEDL